MSHAFGIVDQCLPTYYVQEHLAGPGVSFDGRFTGMGAHPLHRRRRLEPLGALADVTTERHFRSFQEYQVHS